MRNICMKIALTAVAVLALVSCAPEPIYSYPPEYVKTLVFTLEDPKTITLDNQDEVPSVSECKVNDSVTVFIPVTYPGTYITRADYYWTLKDADGKDVKKSVVEQIAPHKQKCPPMWSFGAPPTAGTYTVHFRATYNYSAQTERGEIFGGYPTSVSYEGAGTVKSVLRVR